MLRASSCFENLTLGGRAVHAAWQPATLCQFLRLFWCFECLKTLQSSFCLGLVHKATREARHQLKLGGALVTAFVRTGKYPRCNLASCSCCCYCLQDARHASSTSTRIKGMILTYEGFQLSSYWSHCCLARKPTQAAFYLKRGVNLLQPLILGWPISSENLCCCSLR